MSRSSLLITFVLSHKNAHTIGNKTVSGTEPVPVVVNQGETALKPDSDEVTRPLLPSRLFSAFLLPQKSPQFHSGLV
jgi:hypothetical protein